MKIVLISDTHSLHLSMLHEIPDGDLLIHSGDFSNIGKENEIIDFIEWFSDLPHTYKVFISGNHDLLMDGDKTPLILEKIKLAEKKNTFYLENSSITINGLKIWGHPHVPVIFGSRMKWAFSNSYEELESITNNIPEDIDILISHGPPRGFRDVLLSNGTNIGCENLYKRIGDLKNLKLSCFGHIHEGYGLVDRSHIKDNLFFINASTCNFFYEPSRKPLSVSIVDGVIDFIP